MDYNGGSVSFCRKIREHWIWKNPMYYYWWSDLIYSANYKDTKSVARGKLYILKRGQLEASTEFLAKRWGRSRPTIISFLKLLEGDGMIKRETLYGSKAIITICNYDRYQYPLDTSLDTSIDTPLYTSLDTKRINKEYNKSLDVSNETSSSAKADVSPKPPKKQSKSRKKDPKYYTLGYKCRLAFVEYFEKAYGEEYYYAPKDAKAMQNLIKQITFSRKSKDMPTDDESIVNALKLFLSAINKTWINNNFTVTNISSQYNSIISEIKNRKNNDNRQETSDRRRGYDARTHSAEEYEKDF